MNISKNPLYNNPMIFSRRRKKLAHMIGRKANIRTGESKILQISHNTTICSGLIITKDSTARHMTVIRINTSASQHTAEDQQHTYAE
jgi:hypothetical protein